MASCLAGEDLASCETEVHSTAQHRACQQCLTCSRIHPPTPPLCHCSYDLTAMLFAPVFGFWTDRTRRFKAQVRPRRTGGNGSACTPSSFASCDCSKGSRNPAEPCLSSPNPLPQVLVGAAINAVGNFIYAFTVLAGAWWIMLLSRWAAGWVGGWAGSVVWQWGAWAGGRISLQGSVERGWAGTGRLQQESQRNAPAADAAAAR